MSRLLLNQSVGFKKFKMWGWEEEEGRRGRAWFYRSCGAAASAWGCAVAVASLLLLAQDCAVTLGGSFIAACATAPSPVKQGSPCFLSLFLCLADNQESEPWSHLCNTPVSGAFSSALLPNHPTHSCWLLQVFHKWGNTSWAWAPTCFSFVVSATEMIQP